MADQNAIGEREEQCKENAEENSQERIDGVKKFTQDGAQNGLFGWGAWPAPLPMSFSEHYSNLPCKVGRY